MENSLKYTGGQTNQHWEVIANGIDCRIETARDLWENALTYFQWCDANPIKKPELIRTGVDAGTVYYCPVPRAYTISGLCIQLGLTRDWLYDVANSRDKNEFWMVANKILEIMYTQKLEYTYAGVFSPVIAAKELGLNNAGFKANNSPTINIDVIQGPNLLVDERDVDLPENMK